MPSWGEGDSAVGHSFGLEVDGIQIKSITEVSGLKTLITRRFPGRWPQNSSTASDTAASSGINEPESLRSMALTSPYSDAR